MIKLSEQTDALCASNFHEKVEYMDSERFTMLIEILRFMEKQDLNGKGVEDTVASLIDRFDGNLTLEQKDALIKEFSDYLRKS